MGRHSDNCKRGKLGTAGRAATIRPATWKDPPVASSDRRLSLHLDHFMTFVPLLHHSIPGIGHRTSFFSSSSLLAQIWDVYSAFSKISPMFSIAAAFMNVNTDTQWAYMEGFRYIQTLDALGLNNAALAQALAALVRVAERQHTLSSC
ncbi:hypothetical protein PtB15_5B116 [Puccinia triticina]|nr:hypothetical protein PtB15_5B116 [Puccinia triticina]